MKKLFALFVLAAFVGVVSAPAMTIVEKESPVVVLDQSFDKNLDKDKDKDKKKTKVTKAEKKAESKSGECASSCGEKAGCGETAKKSSSCCGEKTEGKKTL